MNRLTQLIFKDLDCQMVENSELLGRIGSFIERKDKRLNVKEVVSG